MTKKKKTTKTKLPRIPLPHGWKMEAVTAAMRTPCKTCSLGISEIRFKQTIESYPFPSVETHCSACAVSAMRQSVADVNQRINGVEAFIKNYPGTQNDD